MLDSLRKAAGTWVAKLLLLLLVGSFAVWGISGQLVTGMGGNSVIVAGGTEVSATDYRLAYDRQLSVMSQQFGTRITRDQATALGIDNQVLAQLVAGAVLDEQARKLGLGVSRDRVAALTVEDPAFQGPDGRFDRNQFDYVLRQVGMRPEDYLTNREQVAVRQQIVEAVSDGLTAPDAFFRALALYEGEDRTVDFVVLPSSLVEPIEDPSADVLAKWFEDRKANYGAPEYRKISYVKLEPEDIADESAITDDQVAKDYEASKARYTTAETRRIEQLVFASEEAAQAAADSLKAGSTFDQVVAAEGKSMGDVQMGALTKDKVPDPAVAEAAFKLQANEVSPIIKGSFGPMLVRVTEITPETVKSLDDVKTEIRKALALAEANRILLDVHDSYEDARAGGDSLQDAATKLNLKVTTIDAIDRTAQRPDGTIVDDIPESAALLAAAFESEANVENDPINIGSNGFVFFEVEGITPARERMLDEVREKVVADWKVAEVAARLGAKATELEKRLKDGATLDTIAAELKLEKQTKRGLKRQADDADFGRTGVAAAFGVPEKGVGLTPAPTDGGQILFQVSEVFEPAGADASTLPEQTRTSLSQGLADDLLDQLVARLQAEYDVEVDQGAIQRALSF
ncbi:SurA N-terminal domain-containing protein [Arvimicrobium flavum]|uniref:SurA N-terminal domain-containing protein n=1 Tax=Arvimicrobium flavum TaxID=3393320 RepID=UPI00237A9868|nr:SurA N-terminal domain-containing protein [Mesorhizobium shangrilense]